MINNTLFRPEVVKANRKKFNPEGFDLAAAIQKSKAAETEAARLASIPPKAAFDVRNNYVTPFGEPVEHIVNGSSVSDADVVIRAAYRQVFGNAHLMESERAVSAESKLRKGELSVMEFVRALAKSARYRTIFFENCSNLRAIELNFKHLLGRAPENKAEISEHICILAEDGFEAEIDAYIDSDEYLQNFGTDLVPFFRGDTSQPGTAVSSFTHAAQLVKGASNSDKSIANSTVPQLQVGLLQDLPTAIQPLETLRVSTPLIPPQKDQSPAQKLSPQVANYKSPDFLAAPVSPNEWLQRYKALEAASTFPAARQSQPVKLYPSAAGEEIEIVIRAAYKQVFGNVHLMESQRLLTAESQFKQGELTVKEFVRQLALSDTYRSIFFESCSNVRAIEVNFKHFLGRAPENFQEISQHIQILAEGGLKAEINSYFDSSEYDASFGNDTVPYYVAYTSRPGKGVAGYDRILSLTKSASDSDRSVSNSMQASLRSQLQTNLLKPFTGSPKVNVFNPKGYDLALAIGAPIALAKLRQEPPTTVEYTQGLADTQPLEMLPGDSTAKVDIIIAAVYRQVFGNAHLMESERCAVAESQFRSGRMSVLEFVRALAKSDRYRALFFENCTNLKTIELNFKHLLGRAPENGAEVAQHIQILAEQGFEAEIDAYLDSDEYLETFGMQIVPYYRGYQTQTGKGINSYANAFQLLRGVSSSDKPLSQSSFTTLDQALLSNRVSPISKISEQIELVPDASSRAQSKKQLDTSNVSVSTPDVSFSLAATSRLRDTDRPRIWQGQYNTVAQDAPIKLTAGSDVDLVIRAIYKQVLGNAHLMESEQLVSAESKLRNGDITVREFVRQLAKSELYTSRFITNLPRYRCHELNFKHLLGRAPESYDETVYHSTIIDNEGYEADIDVYIDSDEYTVAFGDNTVPYYRGFKSQVGKNLLGYVNMFDLMGSVSTSDKAGPTTARVENRLSYKNPIKVQPVTDGNLLIQQVLGLI